jgi:hypothetical protein
MESLVRGAPLCHFVTSPPRGGRSLARIVCATPSFNDWRKPSRSPISPLAGEMSDRTEGGVQGAELA